MTPGLHIALAGIDGSGKSEQARRVAARLNEDGWRAKYDGAKDDFALDVVRNVAGSGDWREVRRTFGDDAIDLLGALQWARRRSSALALTGAGIHAVTDRSALCRHALHRAAGRRPSAEVRAVIGHGGPPDLTVWLDVDPAAACGRVQRRGVDHERLDDLLRLRDAYAALTRDDAVVRVDGGGTVAEVTARILAVLPIHPATSAPALLGGTS